MKQILGLEKLKQKGGGTMDLYEKSVCLRNSDEHK